MNQITNLVPMPDTHQDMAAARVVARNPLNFQDETIYTAIDVLANSENVRDLILMDNAIQTLMDRDMQEALKKGKFHTLPVEFYPPHFEEPSSGPGPAGVIAWMGIGFLVVSVLTFWIGDRMVEAARAQVEAEQIQEIDP